MESVDIHSTLAAERPDAFLPDLALSLNNLSNRLSRLGRREEALKMIEEAVSIYRMQAADQPNAFPPKSCSIAWQPLLVSLRSWPLWGST